MNGNGSGRFTADKSAKPGLHPGGITPEVRAILACPQCHGDLEDSAQPEGYICAKCSLLFAVVEGIADFVIEDARPWPAKQ